ncbi:hypothetical protein C6N14_08040 [Enterococcus mundtii]|uniref:Uncharacterized protein n=1 Tax=Enterococcus mundtii TaxID=53346 RepID=A0A2T5DCB7_ENTMU|nr:hypothetical protein C6N14_08040 [Enterococcus mundtii]
MVYTRIIKGSRFILLALSIYFATRKSMIYILLVLLSIFLDYTLPNRPKVPYKSKQKAIYFRNQTYGTEVIFETVLTVIVLIFCFILSL